MKRYLLIFCIFFLTGCSVDYRLDVDKELNFNELVQLNSSNENERQNIEDYQHFLPIDSQLDESAVYERKYEDIEYYESRKLNDNKTLQFRYVYDVDVFNNGKIVNTCYQYVTAMNSDDRLILSTSKEFLCFDKFEVLEDVTVTITSRYKLVNTNADSSDNYTYVWNITKDNYRDRSIYLELDLTDRKETWWEKFQKTGFYRYGVIIVIFVILFMGFRFFKKYSERRDKI